MSDLKKLLNRIYEEEKIELIVERLGCSNYKWEQNGKLLTAQLPSGKNKRSLQIKNCPELYAKIWTKDIKGNLFNIVGYLIYDIRDKEEVRQRIYEIKEWICLELEYYDLLNVSESTKRESESTHDPLDWLKEIRKKRNLPTEKKNKILPEKTLNQYINLPHVKWVNEGLSHETQILFGIGYCLESERITIPVRDKDGNLIGIKGRYVGDDEETEEEYKYIYIIPCDKSLELFNLHRALPYIKQRKQVIVVESEKTCLLLTQWGYPNCVAIGGGDLSPQQINMLKGLGLDIEIVLVFDKGIGVRDDIDIPFKKQERNYIKEQIKKFKTEQIRNISVVFDKRDLLENRMSPIDLGEDVWRRLFEKYKYKIN